MEDKIRKLKHLSWTCWTFYSLFFPNSEHSLPLFQIPSTHLYKLLFCKWSISLSQVWLSIDLHSRIFFLPMRLYVIMLISNELNGFSPYLQLQGTNGVSKRVVWGQMGGGVISRWVFPSASGWQMPVSPALRISFVERLHIWWLCPHGFAGQHWIQQTFFSSALTFYDNHELREKPAVTPKIHGHMAERSGEERKENFEGGRKRMGGREGTERIH